MTAVRIRPLNVVPQGEDFVVGDPASGTFVVLPRIGVTVIELLRSGLTVAQAKVEAEAQAGTDLDIDDFIESLRGLGFAEPSDAADAPAGGADDAGAVDNTADTTTTRRRPLWSRLVAGPVAWTAAALAAGSVIALYAARPALLPSVNDTFFLSTPVRSIAALTLLSFALRAVHECCHWLAARAEGVRASITVSRRLYFLVFETDLTGLWALPRKRRYWPLVIGIAFDTAVLAALLTARVAGHPAPQVARLLAALSLLQVTSIASQFFIFLRTDVYAVVLTATGCFDLWRVTRLLTRQRLGLARPAHRAELAAAHTRDRTTARWYIWPYCAGMLLAAWYFAAFFIPATVRAVTWCFRTLIHDSPVRLSFWEAAAWALLLLSPQLLTLWVALRDFAASRGSRHA